MYPVEYVNAAKKATEYIEDGMIVSLGTGRTASAMIHEVGELFQKGLKIKAVPTSEMSRSLAEQYQIPLVKANEIQKIDLAIDGVDEMDFKFNAIKGGGGALYREKVNALMSDHIIWIMTASKKVDFLGSFPLPVEIEPYSITYVTGQLNRLNIEYSLRKAVNSSAFITENQNFILDLKLHCIKDPASTYRQLKSISGVLEVGLFINLCHMAIICGKDGIQVLENKKAAKPEIKVID